MSSRGRPPKNGTPFDRLLKKQCQKGVSATKSAGMVGKWGYASFTSIRNAPMINPSSESVSRPKKFFKSKNSSSSLDNEFEPIVSHPPAHQSAPVAPKAPSKFFKSKQQPQQQQPLTPQVVVSPKKAPPLRPLEVTPNQAVPPVKDTKEVIMKVPPLKLRFKTGAVPTIEPKPIKPPEDEIEEEDEEYSGSESLGSDGGGFEDDHEVSFKEPAIVLSSPNNSGHPNLSSPATSPPTTTASVRTSTRPRRGAALAAGAAIIAATSPTRSPSPPPSAPPVARRLPPAPRRQPPSPVRRSPSPPPPPVRKSSSPALSKQSVVEEPVSSKTIPEIQDDEQNGEEKRHISSALSANINNGKQQQPTIRSYARNTRGQQITSKPTSNFPQNTGNNSNFPSQSYDEQQQPMAKKPKPNEDDQPTSDEIITKKDTKDFENSFKKPLENTEIIEKKESEEFVPAKEPPSIVKAHSWSGSQKRELENNSKLIKAVSISSASDVAASDIMPPPPPGLGASSSGVHRPKKSIFKSKSQGNQDQKRKGLSLYKHSFGAKNNEDKDEEEIRRKVFQQKAMSMDFDEDDLDDHAMGAKVTDMSFRSDKFLRVTTETASRNPDQTMQEVTSVKCPKAQKEYFTVIKNVKQAHQIQDSGESQEFDDNVEWILDGLHMRQKTNTRCLSTVDLASKCMDASFRMHLRAHGTMNQFFAELKDAPKNPGLALCTATVFFILSQDRLNMDMDRDSLELMLNLLDTDSTIKDALDSSGMNQHDLEKNKKKVLELILEMQSKGHAVNLNIENISSDYLSMETLLSMTSKRAGEWFKEELRELGGLDHLVRTISDCLSYLVADEISMWTEQLQNKLTKAGRVLKVLESVTHENEENCQYLLKYENGKCLDLIHKLFKLLDEELPLNPNMDINDKESVTYTMRETLFDVMRVYINLVHDYNQTPFGSKMAGEKSDTFEIVLHTLFIMPDYLPLEKGFDVQVLTLTLMINLMEHCDQNRDLLLKAFLPRKSDDFVSDRKTAAEGLVQLFLEKEENARREETKADDFVDDVQKENKAKEKSEESQKKEQKTDKRQEEIVTELLQKAGRHMEDTLIASYITLIIGYLILDDKDRVAQIRELLPEQNFSIMAAVLTKFLQFMKLTASSTVASNRGLNSTETLLKYLEKIDQPEPEIKDEEENFDDITLFDMTKDESSITLQQPPNMSIDLDDDFDKL